MPGFVSIPEVIILLVFILLIFGPKRLPEIGRSLGKGMREFKHSVSGQEEAAAERPELPAPTREQDALH